MPCSLSAIVEFNLKDIGSLRDADYSHTRPQQHVCRFSIIQVHSYPRQFSASTGEEKQSR